MAKLILILMAALLAVGEAHGAPQVSDLVSSEARLSANVREDWQTGSVVDVTMSVTEPVDGWTVELDAGGSIVNIWNAVVMSQRGTRYVLGPASYNHQIRAGTSIEFGMEIDGGGAFSLVTAEVKLAADVAGQAADAAIAPPPPPSRTAIPTPGGQRAPAAPAAPATTAVPAQAVGLGVSNPTVAEPPGAALQLAAFAPGPFSVRGTRIVDSGGRPVEIHGINWFGFETEIYVPHGLWARNWRDMMDEVRSLGFNTLRIPFSGELVATGGDVSGIDFALNPDLAGLNGIQILDLIVDYADTIGLRVLLDYHRGKPGGGPNDNGLWYGDGRTEADVIAEWQAMAERYRDKPAVIGADLMNEPHMATWGDGSATDWGAAAGRIGNAVLEVAPDWLVIVEGTAVYDGDTYWWGGNLQGVRDHPVRLSAPDKLVYSIHDYPPSVYEQPWFSDGRPLREVWDKNWGYIVRDGIGPVLIGEWGSFLETHADLTWAAELSDYITSLGVPWFWWSLNPNSGDTGGLLADDWTTVRPEVIRVLQPFLATSRPPVPLAASATNAGAVFAVTLDAPAAESVAVRFATVDGTATAGRDYVATAGTLTFDPGETRKSVSVPILPDGGAGGDTHFYLVVGDASGSRASGTAIITGD
ncbi:cellulase family glycosylhydrolase [Acuticoccus sediminis]|uniref:cellulase family glycosylhydrolase n=1 Tax=Acuticoccus sediminis TaxID=2184697 RepID=UPI001CFC80DC|nr:cellulase family glycosylhydrolase [Acuticoccus sediminis]